MRWIRSAAAGAWARADPVVARARAPFGRMNSVDWANIHAKAAGAAWAVAFFLATPSVLAASLGTVLVWIMSAFVLVGAVVSSAGLVIAARNQEPDPAVLRGDLRRSLFGLGVELIGLILIIVGVGLYFATQFALTTALPNGIDRAALTVFAYWMAAQSIARLVAVRHRRRKEARLAATIGGTA